MENMTEKKIKVEKNLKPIMKPRSEMTIDDIKLLPKYTCVFNAKSKSRNNQIVFSDFMVSVLLTPRVELKLRNEYNNQTRNEPLTESEFRYFKLKLGLSENINNFSKMIPIRFVKGVNKNGNEFYRVDLFLTGKLTKSIWLKSIDVDSLKVDGFDMTQWLEVETSLETNLEDIEIDELFN